MVNTPENLVFLQIPMNQQEARAKEQEAEPCDATEKDACDDGCSGGLMTNAYKYLIGAGGIEEEDAYPYTGKRDECKFRLEKVAVKLVNFTSIPVNENQIAAYLVNHGPLADLLALAGQRERHFAATLNTAMKHLKTLFVVEKGVHGYERRFFREKAIQKEMVDFLVDIWHDEGLFD
ncbi:unnamed protein product [Fraxinus pennsylvanica]|uniref:Peptidase C1A papain C-terminal domain-containing protein n=1 Tax=Fraxinus pennsylvanica TaxID=56036 RepID=A0AAD1YYD1_9LAMI|nr:unnamed protein product [Fraxinus pennsylvanica]